MMLTIRSGISNFLVSIAFIPLRDLLASIGGEDKTKGQGRVFFVFTFTLAACGLALARLYKA